MSRINCEKHGRVMIMPTTPKIKQAIEQLKTVDSISFVTIIVQMNEEFDGLAYIVDKEYAETHNASENTPLVWDDEEEKSDRFMKGLEPMCKHCYTEFMEK